MRADEAPEVNHNCVNVGHLPVGSSPNVPVALRFEHCKKQVNVFFGEQLGRRGFRTFPHKHGDVVEVDSGDCIKGEAFTRVVGAVQSSVFYPGSGLECPELGFNRPASAVPTQHGCGKDGIRLSLRRTLGGLQQPMQRLVAVSLCLGGRDREQEQWVCAAVPS